MREFFFVACLEYDENLDIQSSIRNDFEVSFKSVVEPGVISVFDLDIVTKLIDGKKIKEIRLSSLRDNDFYYDCCTFDQG